VRRGSNGSPTAKADELDGVKVFNPEGKAIASSAFLSVAPI